MSQRAWFSILLLVPCWQFHPANGADQCSSGICEASGSGSSIERCINSFKGFPDRRSFFRRVQKPPDVDAEKFGVMLAKGGINPRGVVLNSEFYELPLEVNGTLLWEEARALLKDGGGWEKVSKTHAEQGVVSRHFRLTQSRRGAGELDGPFEEVDGRLARSPYTRSVLSTLGGVVGNTAYMKLGSGGEVGEHFDTNEYWNARVRIHIPIKTNKKAILSCGQLGESYDLNMQLGRIYVLDNHLGHKAKNSGKSSRVHLAVDMVGSRRFWQLVNQARAIGSAPRAAKVPYHNVVASSAESLPLEAWRDSVLQRDGCKAMVDAAATTSEPLGLAREAREVAQRWCEIVQKRRQPRVEEVKLLRDMAALKACNLTVSTRARVDGLIDVLDSIAELHRIDEADSDLAFIGGAVEHGGKPPQ